MVGMGVSLEFDAGELAEIEAALETHLREDLRGWPRDVGRPTVRSDEEWAAAVIEAGGDPDDPDDVTPLVEVTVALLARVRAALGR